MTKYTCEQCLKEFSQKSNYNKHQNKKKPCKDNKGKIEIVENIINKKLISNNTENIITTTMETMNVDSEKKELSGEQMCENTIIEINSYEHNEEYIKKINLEEFPLKLKL